MPRATRLCARHADDLVRGTRRAAHPPSTWGWTRDPRVFFMPVSSISAAGGSTPLDIAENDGHAAAAAPLRADPRVAAALAAADEA